MLNKIRREIKVMKLLSHPNIIKLYGFIDTPSNLFIILEYAEGGDLYELISARGKVLLLFFCSLILIMDT
jgi:serine/threonine protein kinase